MTLYIWISLAVTNIWWTFQVNSFFSNMFSEINGDVFYTYLPHCMRIHMMYIIFIYIIIPIFFFFFVAIVTFRHIQTLQHCTLCIVCSLTYTSVERRCHVLLVLRRTSLFFKCCHVCLLQAFLSLLCGLDP